MRLWLLLLVAITAWGSSEVVIVEDTDPQVLNLLDQTSQRSHVASSAISAGGSFRLGGSSRARHGARAELGESESVSAAQQALAEQLQTRCGTGNCSLADIQNMWSHAWHSGYGSGHRDCPTVSQAQTGGGSAADSETEASGASWGCQNNSVYASEWLVRDQYSGCFIHRDPLVDDSNCIDLTVVTKDIETKGTPLTANKQYWTDYCTNIRRQASFYLARLGECPIDLSHSNTRADFRKDEAWGGYKGGSWATKCGTYQQDRTPGRELPTWVRSANWTGASLALGLNRKNMSDPVMPRSVQALLFIKKSTEHIAGKCLSQKVLKNYGRSAVEVLPGQCLKASGQCACYDGYHVQSSSKYSTANHMFRTFQTMQESFELFAQLLCFDAPGFSCVIPPKEGKWTTQLKEKCQEKFHVKLSSNVSAKVKMRDNTRAKQRRLGEPVAAKQTSGTGFGGAKSLDFRTWASRLLKKKMKKFEYQNLDVLLDKWAMQGKGKGTIFGGLSRGLLMSWLWDHKTWKDVRKPINGMAAQLLQAIGLSKGKAKGMCAMTEGLFSSHETDYEKKIMTKIVIDTKVDYERPVPIDNQLEMWSITAVPKFWRRAASYRLIGMNSGPTKVEKETGFGCLPHEYGYPTKTSNLFKEQDAMNAAKDAPNRKVAFGCPDAVPKVNSQNQLEWKSSGTGEDFVTAHYPNEGPLLSKGEMICSMKNGEEECKAAGLKCAHRLSFKQTTCSTCCCKEGLVSSDVESKLVFGGINECGKWFNLMDGLFRMYVAFSVTGWSHAHFSPICLNPITIRKSNSEICQRFKCDAKKGGAEETLKQPSDAELSQLCDDYTCR